MALLGIVILVLVILIFVLFACYVVTNFKQLAMNTIFGLITLLVVNFFHLMQYFDRPDIGFTWITIIICALAGLPGALLLILLSLVGITL
jgi:hypothetical protein